VRQRTVSRRARGQSRNPSESKRRHGLTAVPIVAIRMAIRHFDGRSLHVRHHRSRIASERRHDLEHRIFLTGGAAAAAGPGRAAQTPVGFHARRDRWARTRAGSHLGLDGRAEVPIAALCDVDESLLQKYDTADRILWETGPGGGCRLPAAAGRQVDRRGLRRFAQPSSRAADHLGVPGGQGRGRIRGETVLTHHPRRQWDYGNGKIGSQGIHAIDVTRWPNCMTASFEVRLRHPDQEPGVRAAPLDGERRGGHRG